MSVKFLAQSLSAYIVIANFIPSSLHIKSEKGSGHKRKEEGSGVVPIHELYLLQPGVQPTQIAPRHHQYYGAVPNA